VQGPSPPLELHKEKKEGNVNFHALSFTATKGEGKILECEEGEGGATGCLGRGLAHLRKKKKREFFVPRPSGESSEGGDRQRGSGSLKKRPASVCARERGKKEGKEGGDRGKKRRREKPQRTRTVGPFCFAPRGEKGKSAEIARAGKKGRTSREG